MPASFTGEFCVWRVELCGNEWRAVTYACRLNRETRNYELKNIASSDKPIITGPTLDAYYIFEDVAKAAAAELNDAACMMQALPAIRSMKL